MPPRPEPATSARIATGLAAWLVIALAIGFTGALESLPRPALQAILFALTAAVLVAGWRVRSLNDWLRSVDLRVLVLLHTTRFVGFYFLYLHARGRLPHAFAVPAGWGDNIVAAGAVVVLLLPTRARFTRPATLIWNTLGLADILMVVVTAARLGLTDPASLRELTVPPLSLLPTFLVPLVIATHVLIFWRLRTPRYPGGAGATRR